MVRQFTSSMFNRNRIFADHGVPGSNVGPAVCRTSHEINGSVAYTRKEPKHDPCAKYDMGKVLFAIRRCSHPEVAEKAESWVHMNTEAFIRSPRVNSPTPGSVVLSWRYDQETLRLRFTRVGVSVNGKDASRHAALAAVLAWNRHVIAGEMARIRAAGLPPESPATAVSELTLGDDGW